MLYQGRAFIVAATVGLNDTHTHTHTAHFVSNVVYLLATLMLLHDDLLPMLAMSLILNAACALNLDMR